MPVRADALADGLDDSGHAVIADRMHPCAKPRRYLDESAIAVDFSNSHRIKLAS
jgi:hypothetical protein